jgi:hypothetical protein
MMDDGGRELGCSENRMQDIGESEYQPEAFV